MTFIKQLFVRTALAILKREHKLTGLSFSELKKWGLADILRNENTRECMYILSPTKTDKQEPKAIYRKTNEGDFYEIDKQ